LSDDERALIRNLQTHDLAESLRLRRAAHAKAANLPPEAFSLPFPGNQSSVVNNHASGWLKGSLLSTALLTLGGLAGAGLGRLPVNGDRPALPGPAPARPTPELKAQEYEIDFRVEGGELKVEPPRPVKE
jgi:hypothetical protein